MSLQNPAIDPAEPSANPLWALFHRARDTTAAASPLVGYGSAVILAMGAAALAASAREVLASSVFLPFYPVVLLAAWVGRPGPGLLASVLSAAAVHALLLPSTPPLWPRGPEALLLLSFVAVGAIASYQVGALRRACHAADAQRVAANQFAATLHLRLMLAEKEIERLQAAGESEPSVSPAQGAEPAPPASGSPVHFFPLPPNFSPNGRGSGPSGPQSH